MRPAYGTTVRRWLWLLALASAHATGAEPLSLRVEPETVVVDRSFHLLFETDREVRADPDLSPLETDFEVVTQTRTRVQMRGRRDQPARTSWRIERPVPGRSPVTRTV